MPDARGSVRKFVHMTFKSFQSNCLLNSQSATSFHSVYKVTLAFERMLNQNNPVNTHSIIAVRRSYVSSCYTEGFDNTWLIGDQ